MGIRETIHRINAPRTVAALVVATLVGAAVGTINQDPTSGLTPVVKEVTTPVSPAKNFVFGPYTGAAPATTAEQVWTKFLDEHAFIRLDQGVQEPPQIVLGVLWEGPMDDPNVEGVVAWDVVVNGHPPTHANEPVTAGTKCVSHTFYQASNNTFLYGYEKCGR